MPLQALCYDCGNSVVGAGTWYLLQSLHCCFSPALALEFLKFQAEKANNGASFLSPRHAQSS